MEHLLGDVTLGEGGCLFEVVFCVDDFVGDLVKVLGGNDEGRPVLDEVDEVDYLFRHLCTELRFKYRKINDYIHLTGNNIYSPFINIYSPSLKI